MVTLDLVEKLKQRADVSYDEAKAALEETNGDILEAVINLEKRNRIKPPEGEGYYSSKESLHKKKKDDTEVYKKFEQRQERKQHMRDTLHGFFSWVKSMILRGNRNHFEVIRNGGTVISIPVTILVLALCFAFWMTIPVLVVGLFFGFRYTFSGPDLGKDGINRAMDNVANVAENLKKEVKGEDTNEENPNN